MKRKALAFALMLVILAVVVTGWWVVISLARSIAPLVLEAGPNGIDLRSTPGTISPGAALPQKVARYEREASRSVEYFHGIPLGRDAMEATYFRPGPPTGYDNVHVIAAHMATSHDAAQTVRDLAQQLKEEGAEVSGRWHSEEPHEGWWSPAGKRNFTSWNAPAWDTDQSGFVWQSGDWFFVVTCAHGAFQSEVAKEFPY